MVPPEIMNVNIFPRMTVFFIGSVQHQSQSYDKEVQFFLNAQIYTWHDAQNSWCYLKNNQTDISQQQEQIPQQMQKVLFVWNI